MRGFDRVLKLAAQPKSELPAQAPDRARSGSTGSCPGVSRVRDRQHMHEVRNPAPISQPKSEAQKLMEAWATGNAQREADEKARNAAFAQRAAERTRAEQIEARRQIIRILRESDALLVAGEVTALARALGHEHNPNAYPALIAQVKKIKESKEK
jgi:hypothetical protein